MTLFSFTRFCLRVLADLNEIIRRLKRNVILTIAISSYFTNASKFSTLRGTDFTHLLRCSAFTVVHGSLSHFIMGGFMPNALDMPAL
jgi:hypothetical protein